MCGIVGYLGQKDAYSILIEALQKLEYRGYDSAGMAVWCDGRIKVARQKGKVEELRKVCDGSFRGDIGLAHTRWATHGTPSERNAHPHRADDVVVIHNGIVENYVELKEGLRQKGHKFLSDTDTEVIPHLVAERLKAGQDFVGAVRSALGEMTGAYALGIIREGERTLIAAKKESPLVLGIGDGEFFVASDAPALIGRTNKFVFLEDYDMAVMRDGEISITDITGAPVERTVHTINWTGAMAEKGGYKHFMLKEIHEQPRAISDTLIGRVKEERGEVEFEELKLPPLRGVKKVWMIACGTSYHSCLIGKNMFETNLRVPVEVDIASEFRYRNPIIGKNDVVLLVSQSGETADTIAVMKEAKKQGIFTLSICNVLGSTLARDSDGVIFTHAGPEIGVASTKAFTTQISVFYLLMLHLAKRLGIMDVEAVRQGINEIRKIPHKIQLILDEAIDAIGIDPERDLDQAAIALHRMSDPNGPNGPVAYSMVLVGKITGQRLNAWLDAHAATRESYAGHTIYSIPSEGRTVRVVQIGYDTIAASNFPTAEKIHAIIDRHRTAAWPLSGSTLLERHYHDVPLLSLAWGVGQIGLPFSESGAIQIFGLAVPLEPDSTIVASLRLLCPFAIRSALCACASKRLRPPSHGHQPSRGPGHAGHHGARVYPAAGRERRQQQPQGTA